LLTNDGEFALRMAHPRYHVDKEYQVNCFGVPDDRDLARLERGITIEGKRTHPAQVNMVYASPEGHQATLRIVIHEGRKRQVRLMMEAVGHPVKDLSRVRIAHLTIKGMQPGECRRLPMKDVDRLKALVGLQPSDRVPVRETGRAPKKSS
jgi:pseudouridine synthase